MRIDFKTGPLALRMMALARQLGGALVSEGMTIQCKFEIGGRPRDLVWALRTLGIDHAIVREMKPIGSRRRLP